MTPTQKRIIRAAQIHLVAGTCAMIAQIGVAVFLITTAYWPLGFVLIVCSATIRKADAFMASLDKRTGE